MSLIKMEKEIYLGWIAVSSYREQYHVDIHGNLKIVRWVVSNILMLDGVKHEN